MKVFGRCLLISGLSLVGTLPALASTDLSELNRLARASLSANLFHLKMGWIQKAESVPFPKGDYLAAGSHQFKALWTRDFCFASRGLYSIGRADVVKRQLSLIIENLRREDGLVPRYLGSASHLRRNIGYALHLPIPLGGHLEPEFDAGSGGEGQSIDSNALILLAALEYVRRTGDQAWWEQYRPFLMRIFKFYEGHRDPSDGLVIQNGFADWQDSVSREGKTAFVNLLYFLAAQGLAKDPAFRVTDEFLERQKSSFLKTFLDPASGLYISLAGHPELVSLDSNLLAIDWGFLAPGSAEAVSLYQNLKRHVLWTDQDIPGYATAGRYPIEWIGNLPKMINVPDYHDQMYWSWLIALSGKVARDMGDDAESDRILSREQELVVRDGGVTEVYEHDSSHVPVSRVVNVNVLSQLGYRVYNAERPFSWGAGMTLDALETR